MLKSASDLPGLRNIKSMHTTGQRSIPQSEESVYLNLFMLRKEKERLEKEKEIGEKRIKGIDNRLAEIQKEIDRLEGYRKEKPRLMYKKPVPIIEKKTRKRMVLHY